MNTTNTIDHIVNRAIEITGVIETPSLPEGIPITPSEQAKREATERYRRLSTYEECIGTLRKEYDQDALVSYLLGLKDTFAETQQALQDVGIDDTKAQEIYDAKQSVVKVALAYALVKQ